MRAPDDAFTDPRWAVLYDVVDDDRRDLDLYAGLTEEFAARVVVDIGCGTGALAVRLAARGLTVVGVDPADASLTVARSKPEADRVTWIHGDATSLDGRGLSADLAVMTGNVAQVFVTDDDWGVTLASVWSCLRPGGVFAVETRRPHARDWEQWDMAPTPVARPGHAPLMFARSVLEVALPLVTFVTTATIDGQSLSSRSTLRFRSRGELEADLDRHGFDVIDVRDDPTRPGKEYVFLSRRRG